MLEFLYRYVKVILLLYFVQIYFIVFSQTNRKSINFRDESLHTAINKVSENYQVNILYNPNVLPMGITVSGNYTNLSVSEMLDVVLKNTDIVYKFQKSIILLCRKNEVVRESYQLTQTYKNSNIDSKHTNLITDTVLYSIVSFDTVFTEQKVLVYDTVRIFDTIKVFKNFARTPLKYRLKLHSFAVEATYSGGVLFSNIETDILNDESLQLVQNSINSKISNSINLGLMYRANQLEFETGISLLTNIYSFQFNYVPIGSLAERKYISDLHYQYLSVPISVGYALPYHKTIFDAKIGMNIKSYMKSDGYFLNTNETKIFVDQRNAPDTKASLSALFGIGAEYEFTSKSHFVFQFCYQTNVYSFAQNQSLYYLKSTQIGVKTGFRYFF